MTNARTAAPGFASAINKARQLLTISLIGSLMLSLIGCGSVGSRPEETAKVDIVVSKTKLPEYALLDVWIEVFDAAKLPAERKQRLGINEAVREAEQRFIPGHLKRTLENTGAWGAVRVVPPNSDGAELLVQGTIIESNGELLELRIRASDARGHRWLDKTYQGSARENDYRRTQRGSKDAFQSVYNDIANDLLRLKQRESETRLRAIRSIAELQFAADMAPDIFAKHVSKDANGEWKIRRLPASNDPYFRRIRALRERDLLLIDTLNGHYDAYYRDTWNAYEDWREARVEEIENVREIEAESTRNTMLGIGAIALGVLAEAYAGRTTDHPGKAAAADSVGDLLIIGGALITAEGIQKDDEKQIHIDSLHELSDSFESEVSPLVVEVDGETHRLTGSAEQQYAKWRALLAKLYARETGG